MSWLLDTNVCIRYLNGRAPSLRQRIEQTHPSQVFVCSVVKAELYYGASRSGDPSRSRAAQQEFLEPYCSLAFDDAAAEAYAGIRSQLAAAGMIIGPNDLMIAAIAIANEHTLVTHNVDEFSRVDGLRWEDWERDL